MTTLAPTGSAAVHEPANLVALRSGAGAALVTATVLASMVGFLNARIVTVAVPAIGADLGASVAQLQWVVTGFLVTVTALLLLSGALADLLGRRRLLVAGLLITLAASLLCAVAPSTGTLIAARLGQGVGGALVIPSSLALLDGVLRPEDRARGIGIWAGLATLGSTVGPFAGGWLVDHASWRWIFLLNLPLVLGALLALRRIPAPPAAATHSRVDVPGALLAVLALGGVVYTLNQGPSHGWLSAGVLLPGLAGIVATVALVPTERRTRAPMLRLSLFRVRQFDAINAMTLLFYGALGAGSYLIVLQCQLRLGYSATQAGAVLIPQGAVFLVLAPLSGALVARVGPRRLITAGVLISAGAIAWFAAAQPGDAYWTALLPPGLLWGVGSGLAVTPLTAAVLAAVGDRHLGEGSAINVVASRLGALVTIAVVPALIGASGGDGLAAALDEGYAPAMLALAGLCVVAGIVTWLFVTDARADGGVRTPALDHDCTSPMPAQAPHVETREATRVAPGATRGRSREGRAMPRTHYLSDDDVHYKWDVDNAPRLTIGSGDTVVLLTRDVGDGQVGPGAEASALETFDWDRAYPLTGPIAVEGAMPGDVLRVEMLDVRTRGWGWTGVIPGNGLLPDDFPNAYVRTFDLTDGETAWFREDIAIPLAPYFGTMGVCPAGAKRQDILPPGTFGGNMDIRQTVRGSTLWLPIEVEGAMFSCGDAHGAQGDGEVCVTAIEAPMYGALRFTVERGRTIPAPQFRTPAPLTPRVDSAPFFGTTGVNGDLYVAAQDAVRAMVDHLATTRRLSPEDAYLLCSLVVDLKISEIVDGGQYIVSAVLPEAIFTSGASSSNGHVSGAARLPAGAVA